ncbi:hypothetical protein LY76DRAFT_517418 [Colletotrichum caudatum]|nr:hypothetical protein LY76DRAFT_517418 [Colletotrichum caudatum]
MAIDCIDPIKARVEVYARTLSNSESVLADVFTLGGTQTDEATLKGVEAAEKICHRLLEEPQGIAPYQRKDSRDMENSHKGICFALELKRGVERINIKAHLPWGHGHGQTARIGDAQTIENFPQELRSLYMDKSAEKFRKRALMTAEL